MQKGGSKALVIKKELLERAKVSSPLSSGIYKSISTRQIANIKGNEKSKNASYGIVTLNDLQNFIGLHKFSYSQIAANITDPQKMLIVNNFHTTIVNDQNVEVRCEGFIATTRNLLDNIKRCSDAGHGQHGLYCNIDGTYKYVTTV